MDSIIEQKLEGYLELLDEIKQRIGDDDIAMTLLSEIAKDLRMNEIQQERSFNGNAPATEAQLAYLRRLGAVIPEGLTRSQASKLIDSTKALRNQAGVARVHMRIP